MKNALITKEKKDKIKTVAKKILGIVLITIIAITLVGCDNKQKRTEVVRPSLKTVENVQDLGKYLEIENKEMKIYTLINAIDGYGFKYKDGYYEVYEFDSKKYLDIAKKTFKDKDIELVGKNKNILIIPYAKKPLSKAEKE